MQVARDDVQYKSLLLGVPLQISTMTGAEVLRLGVQRHTASNNTLGCLPPHLGQ